MSEKTPGKFSAQCVTGSPIKFGRRNQDDAGQLKVDVSQAASMRDREERVYLIKLAIELKIDVTGWEQLKLRDLRTMLLTSVRKIIVSHIPVDPTVVQTVTLDDAESKPKPRRK